MTTLFNFQFPESHKIILCWDADVRPKSEIHPISVVQMTSSRVRLGQSFKTVGCGCTSCWGDLGAGSVEADVFIYHSS